MEFCTRRELVNQTGHEVGEWPEVVFKELVDNALDACEEAEIAPVISVAVKGGSIVVKDNGPGIPAKTIDGVLDYSIRVSSREAYVSPTRGAQGNALKTILRDGLRARTSTVAKKLPARPSSRRTDWRITSRSPSITSNKSRRSNIPRSRHPSSVAPRITVKLPTFPYYGESEKEVDLIERSKEDFLRLAEAYAWLNPHLSLRVTWNGEAKIDIKASNPAWPKWLPSWQTSAHWYDQSRFRRYMAAHIANRGNITVREFISEFRGMTGTAKQKAVLAETGASHVSLHNFFGHSQSQHQQHRASCWRRSRKHTKPVRAAELGVIGKDHFYRLMEQVGGDPKTFTYNRSLSETGGIPRVTEFAFGIHRDGLSAARGPSRQNHHRRQLVAWDQ